ncbi:beta-eliminating lyase [Diaporthe amygdali]|uniref:beta-eliminating lyase n=1 Tax=Phomopsis amygdali TaxID=1214568 RepID=UPI0022FE0C08|nr:beta-eliminating lyase [Diaporthe amygdali]KAJ0108532.1 beta-eliminating lyase [Diaporthe amygdali]
MTGSSSQRPSAPAHNALVVRSLLTVAPKEREQILKDVEYNVFAFPAGLVTCDYLSDSGTSAMTDVQWAAWPHQLERPNFFIVPQGRCAENLLFSTLSSIISEVPNDTTHLPVIISNGFFDTTGANAVASGFELQTFTQPGLNDPFPPELIGRENPFKGNLDIGLTEEFMFENPQRVTMLLMTITNNWAAAQPVSMANIQDAASLAHRQGIPLFFDACRFAENAYFIQRYEAAYANKSISEIVREMFSYAEGFTISLKKDGLSNMGGVLCFRDEGHFAQKYPGIGLLLKERQILTYGNDSYGGMSGRDLMAATAGLYEVTKQVYLESRITQVENFAVKVQAAGISVFSPPGGHAIYLNMDDFFLGCGRSPGDFASVGFTLELIKDYGIRAVEAGPFGWAWDLKAPQERAKIPNLVRFAVPRHVMSDDHIEYTVAAIQELHSRRHTVPNVVITRGKTMRLRHFSCGLKPVKADQTITGTYIEAVSRQLAILSSSLKHSAAAGQQLQNAFGLAAQAWGHAAIPSEPGYNGFVSNVTNDGAPHEYSVAISQRTGDAELRFLVEAQPNENTWMCLRNEALCVTKNIATECGKSVSLDRFNLIRDLLLPEKSKNGNATMAMWHSCALLPSSEPHWKVYFDPSAASGRSPAARSATTCEALSRLGLGESWAQLKQQMSPDEYVIYFSLDLCHNAEARVKVYVAHPNATAAEVARKHDALCESSSDSYEIQRFCLAMSGGSFGPFTSKPLISCFAFTSSAPGSSVGTVHFPIDAYVSHDAEARKRIERYYQESTITSPLCRERYTRALEIVQRRPLQQGPGIHAWVSLKMKSRGDFVNTFYMCPEIFRKI